MQLARERVRVGITLGDPAGVGPEIVVKALTEESLYHRLIPVIFGNPAAVERALHVTKLSAKIATLERPSGATGVPGQLEVVARGDEGDLPPFGQVDARGGRAAVRAIESAVDAAKHGEVDAITTAPLNKEAVRLAGYTYPGHTEMLAELFQVTGVYTMFVVGNLRVFFLTRHHPLATAIQLLTTERIYTGIAQCIGFLRQLGFDTPTLAVAALNPHGGENGLLGVEEQSQVIPAVRQAQAEGLPVVGPIPADAVFFQAHQGRYTAVLSLYHDQGHIATKTLDFFGTVSVTLGLPMIRTSVDHGTAFDIAGHGVADPHGQVEALKVAVDLVQKGL